MAGNNSVHCAYAGQRPWGAAPMRGRAHKLGKGVAHKPAIVASQRTQWAGNRARRIDNGGNARRRDLRCGDARVPLLWTASHLSLMDCVPTAELPWWVHYFQFVFGYLAGWFGGRGGERSYCLEPFALEWWPQSYQRMNFRFRAPPWFSFSCGFNEFQLRRYKVIA